MHVDMHIIPIIHVYTPSMLGNWFLFSKPIKDETYHKEQRNLKE